MDNINKRFVLIGAGLLIIVLVVILILNRDKADREDVINGEVVNAGDPLDPTIEFYDNWLEAVKSTTTNPVEANLVNNEFLSESVREYISLAQTDTERTVDPVLCQSTTPERLGAKVSFVLDSKAQLLIIARGGAEKSAEMAVVDLTVVNNKWQITNINCSAGESAPIREFSFERKGFLLKSVPPPLNSEYWHLVFEENGQLGHTVPLFFNADSLCVAFDGTEMVCDETQFQDATQVIVKGEMTESGTIVKRVEFLAE